MKKAIFLLIVFLSTTRVIHAQTIKSDGIRLHVLHLNHVGKTYKLNTEDSTVTYLRYLGRVSTAKGKIYKILYFYLDLGPFPQGNQPHTGLYE